MIDDFLYLLVDVICYPIGKVILKLVTFGKLEVTLGGRWQPLASLLGSVFLICLVVGIFFFINHVPE
jgi:hypothetical protein